jgi:predicted RNase H-like HicB family nuclease
MTTLEPTRQVPAFAVVYEPQADGSWSAHFVDIPRVRAVAPSFGLVKARIAEAGREAYEQMLPAERAALPRAVVGYAHLDRLERVVLLEEPLPRPF